MSFYSKLGTRENYLCREIFLARGNQDIEELSKKYDVDKPTFILKYRDIIKHQFSEETNL